MSVCPKLLDEFDKIWYLDRHQKVLKVNGCIALILIRRLPGVLHKNPSIYPNIHAFNIYLYIVVVTVLYMHVSHVYKKTHIKLLPHI